MKTSSPFSPLRRITSGQWLPACAWVLLAMTGAARATDVYLKIEGIPGEISTGRFAGWSQLHSANADVIVPPVVPPAPASPTVFGVRVLKELDRCTPNLVVKCASGEHIPRLSLAFVEGENRYLRVTLHDVLVSSIAMQGQSTPPIEEVSFTFQKIEWSYTDGIGDDAGLTATFDTATQTGATKPRVPFRATLDRSPNGTLLLSCPVESGHTYRIRSNATLNGPWQTVSEFTADIDGTVEQSVRITGQALFYSVEEVQ